MQQTNRIGLIAVATTLIIVFAVFGAYKAVQSIFFSNEDDATNKVAANETHVDNPQDEWDPLIQNLYRNDDATSSSTINEDVVQPLTEEEVATVKEQLNVPSTDTYTGRYLSQLPADMPREEVMDPERITQFVNNNKGQTLPTISKEDISIQDDSSKAAIEEYLATISPLQNSELKQITSEDIEKAFAARSADPTTSAMEVIINDLNSNKNLLRAVAAPTETVDLHLKLIAASEALVENVTLLNNTATDFIGGLIAAKRLESLGDIFQELDKEIKDLESKYSIT